LSHARLLATGALSASLGKTVKNRGKAGEQERTVGTQERMTALKMVDLNLGDMLD